MATTESRSGAEAGLVRALGVPQLTATIINYIVGSGIFALPAVAYALLGRAAPLGYVATAAMMLLVALCIAAAGSRVAISGGPYAYAQVALGPIPGVLTGWIACLANVASCAAVAVLFVDSAMVLVGASRTPAITAFATVILLALFAWLNVRGVRTGARAVEVTTIAKLLPLVLFVLVGAFFVHRSSAPSTHAPTVGDISRSVGILVFAFAGTESAVSPGGEVTRPSRTVPIAVLLGLTATAALYIGIQVVAQGVLGAQLAADRVTPLATAAQAFAGESGREIILVSAAVSMLGFLIGDLLAAPRVLFAFGRDGVLPAIFGAVHARFRTPHVAIVTYAAVAAAIALTGTFEQLVILANVSIMSLYFMCAIAALVLQRRDVRLAGEPFRLRGGVAIPLLAMLTVAWIVAHTITRREVVALLIVVVFALVLYAVRARRIAAASASMPVAESGI